MSTYNLRVPEFEGIPMRAVSPAVTMGSFTHIFAAAPTDARFVLPGNNAQIGVGQGAWLLYTRSVVSWAIRYEGAQGASLIIDIASTSAIGVPLWANWQIFGLQPDNVLSAASGIELPAGQLARFSIESGTAVAGTDCEGCITMRGI